MVKDSLRSELQASDRRRRKAPPGGPVRASPANFQKKLVHSGSRETARGGWWINRPIPWIRSW